MTCCKRVIAATLVLSGMLAGCEPLPSHSPERAALERQYEMGCRPGDVQGYGL